MTLNKRKRPGKDYESSSDADSGDQVDISSVLTGKKPKRDLLEDAVPSSSAEEGDDDDGLVEVIKKSIEKRNIKSGTELLKKTKGKAKIAKGEVGGGSFQSMGTLHLVLFPSSH